MAFTPGQGYPYKSYPDQDLIDIARHYCNNSTIQSIYITTNGSLPERIENFCRQITKEFPYITISISISIDDILESHDEIRKIGADVAVDRSTNLIKEFGKNKFDIVIDLVAGSNWPQLLDILKPGGRYASSGAIAGPITELDVRTLYLKDLTLYGCTYQPKEVFTNLIGYVERNEIRPLVAKTYSLKDIKQAQEEFLLKKHIGKLVVMPPHDNV